MCRASEIGLGKDIVSFYLSGIPRDRGCHDSVTLSFAAPLLLEVLRVELVRTLPKHDEGKSANGFAGMFRDSAPHNRYTVARRS